MKDDINDIRKYLEQREPIFHNRNIIHMLDDALNQMSNDFFEVGASGNIYCKEYVLNTLKDRYANNSIDIMALENWSITNFKITNIAECCYLVTYTLHQADRVTQRSTIWKGTLKQGFKIIYHQGTIIQGEVYGK